MFVLEISYIFSDFVLVKIYTVVSRCRVPRYVFNACLYLFAWTMNFFGSCRDFISMLLGS